MKKFLPLRDEERGKSATYIHISRDEPWTDRDDHRSATIPCKVYVLDSSDILGEIQRMDHSFQLVYTMN